MNVNIKNGSHAAANHQPALSLPTQMERVLTAMLYDSGLNAQLAEKPPIFARHLCSVIGALSHRHHLLINRLSELVRGYANQPVFLNRYWVDESNVLKAQQLIDQWRQRRKAPPIDWPNFKNKPLEHYFKKSAIDNPISNGGH
ncbi:hypothetical protein JYB88_09735 [Shewanella cyperi]|uniref:Uncharacterized protein n=1 Tax=Shewanella cyperi TaxID=2814292 RepID=A0A974XJU2_9GAMM|nr:hypothetical protein [Shewanella cyperi]QSX28583.1 hypothetical protein JYB88_09735 [Shewanella cyperi]